MNLGYYFHVAAVFRDGAALIPEHYAMFVRGLADEAGSLTFYAHSTAGDGTETAPLDQPNIRVVDLGPRRGAPARILAGPLSLQRFNPGQDGVDAMIVRAPTPLLTWLIRRCKKQQVPVLPMFVDELRKWAPSKALPAWRNAVLPLLGRVYMAQTERVMATMPTAAIAQAIYEGHEVYDGNLVFTATVTDADLQTFGSPRPRWPSGLGVTEPLRLLFTGRFAEGKGLFELVEAMALLAQRGTRAQVELVGYSGGDGTLELVLERATALGIADDVIVTGFVPAGPPLLQKYRDAHMYVLPTYGEGSVPRTIKEALSARTPVITTDIPHISEFLHDGEHAVFVPPRSAAAVADAITRLLADEDLAVRIADGGFEWASRLTNERSAQRVLEVLTTRTMQR